MVQGYKVELKPNNKQKKKLIKCFGVARFAYNWALDYQIKNYEQGNKYISESNLRKKKNSYTIILMILRNKQ